MQALIQVKLQLPLTMINNHSFRNLFILLFILGGIFLPLPLKGQFIDLNLEIEPEVKAETLRPLEFGVLATNTGRHSIDLGDINMGIFGITALEGQELLVSLQKPKSLTNTDPSIVQTIPLQLFARYGFSYNGSQNSTLLSGPTNNIYMEEDPGLGPWNTMYIFIYGDVDIGNIPNGIYDSQIVLNVEYL